MWSILQNIIRDIELLLRIEIYSAGFSADLNEQSAHVGSRDGEFMPGT